MTTAILPTRKHIKQMIWISTAIVAASLAVLVFVAVEVTPVTVISASVLTAASTAAVATTAVLCLLLL